MGSFSELSGVWDKEAGGFRLLAPFTYESDEGVFTVPAGFVTDFDSVPRGPFMYWLFKGRSLFAPVVHDFLYETQPFSRRKADRIFLLAMRDEGTARRHRWAKYLGVRIGGWYPWRRHRRRLHQ